jgi:hypothetical protein
MSRNINLSGTGYFPLINGSLVGLNLDKFSKALWQRHLNGLNPNAGLSRLKSRDKQIIRFALIVRHQLLLNV